MPRGRRCLIGYSPSTVLDPRRTVRRFTAPGFTLPDKIQRVLGVPCRGLVLNRRLIISGAAVTTHCWLPTASGHVCPPASNCWNRDRWLARAVLLRAPALCPSR